MNQVIDIPRSVVPACDVDWNAYVEIVNAATRVEKVKAVKVGIALALGHHGLPSVTALAKDQGLKVIYDHQKAGTDIHEVTPDIFMDRMVEAGVDAVILFPLSGPVVQYEWTKAAQERNLGAIIGGEMTHPWYLDRTDLPEKVREKYISIFGDLGFGGMNESRLSGYIRQDAPRDIFRLALAMGIRDFVVPGNKPDRIRYFYRHAVGAGVAPTFYSPGLVAQGGSLGEGAQVVEECAGFANMEPSFHGIVGRGITKAADKRAAMEELTAKL